MTHGEQILNCDDLDLLMESFGRRRLREELQDALVDPCDLTLLYGDPDQQGNGLIGFQRGVMVLSRFQLGLPA
jgi:hypothetical protein